MNAGEDADAPRGLDAGGAEAACAAGGVGEGVGFGDVDAEDGGDDELGDAHAGFDVEVCVGGVEEKDGDFAAVAFVNGAGGVEDGDAVFEGEAAAGADLGFGVGGELDLEAGGDLGVAACGDGGGLDCADVHAGVTGVGVGGEDGGGVDAFEGDVHKIK